MSVCDVVCVCLLRFDAGGVAVSDEVNPEISRLNA